ncbi:MAG: PQQ-binding-like beta-propeller repeat protein [Calditrichaeota bacterium]|nr:PQQ-binding-like beta-propeller repeat protein [Calditrichota bacterium]
MKAKMIFLALLAVFLTFACQKKNSTGPADENIHPQQDIPWPSLADSPWPMFHHDPQGSGRSPYPGPTKGRISKTVTIAQGGSKFTFTTIGSEGHVYLSVGNIWSDSLQQTDGYLFKFDKSGNLIWKVNLDGYDIYNSPLIDKDGIIYIGSTDGCFYAINPDGSIKWKFCTDSEITGDLRGANIGLDGTLYFSTVENFYALNSDGTAKWSLPGYGNTRALISPDGNTIYVYSVSSGTLKAMDNNGNLMWDYPFAINLLVDSYGRVYAATSDSTYAAINENGKLIWEFSIGPHKNRENDRIDCSAAPTIDRMGNFYFLTVDDLYSLDYSGELRWIIRGVGGSGAHLTCDSEGNIYLISPYSGESNIFSISTTGFLNWKLGLPFRGYTSCALSISSDGKMYVISLSYDLAESKLYIIE